MEIYENENDQVDALKRFFAENGKALAVGVILGVGALVGWRYWNNHQVDSARGSSLQYENTVSAIRADQPQTLAAAEKFAADNKNTYGALETLGSGKGEGYAAIVADLRGEALLSKGDKQGARSAWEAGVKSNASPALSEMLQMKINNLSV